MPMLLKRLLFLIPLLLASVVFAQEMDNGFFFATATTFCTGATVSKTWTAPYDVKIQSSEIWFGLDAGCQADVNALLVRKSDGAIINIGNHDDYLNGGEVRLHQKDFGSNYFTVKAGDSLVLTGQCMDFKTSCHGTWGATVWTVK